MGKGGFDGIHPLHDNVLIGAGGSIQHRTQGQRRQLVQQPCADTRQHMEGGMVGEGRGHAVQHIAQYPAARHPHAERQAAGKLRRAVYQRGDDPNDDKIRNKRAGDAQQRRKDTQGVFAAAPFCQLYQPRGSRALWLKGFIHGKLLCSILHAYAARCFFTMRLPMAAPMNAATITPAASATDTQDCKSWDAARMVS